VPVLCEAMCNYNWIELVGDPDAVEITDVGDNDNLGFFPIGFPFEFYGETYLLFRFASNGFITFGSTSGAFDNQCPLPTTDGPNGAIYALWDDLDPSSGGTFWYKNDTENGRCIIEWSQVPFFGLPGTATFEIVLHQYGGIRLQYKDVAYFNGATIGIENQDGTEATEYCCNGFGDVCPMNEFCICMDCIPFGTLQGYVRQFPTNQPVPGAIVEVVATGQTTTANETGFYQMVVPCGSQQIRAMKEEFCTVTSTVVVACNAVTEQNFLLRKPRIQVQPDPVMAVCRNNMTCQDTFWVSNVGGRCPLEFTIEILGRNESGGWGHLDDVWLIVDPDTGSVGQDSTLAIYLTYDPDTMAANLNALLRIHHNAAGTPYELFVSLQVLSADIRQVGIPTEFVLYQNFPNPFNPVTSIFFDLPVREHVRLEIFNIVGQKVATLVDEPMVAGYHAVQFDAGNLPSGLYLYRVQAGEWTALKKMMLVK